MSRRRNCLITGASRGIGLGIARQLDAENCRLALTARNAESEKKLSQELAGFHSHDHLPVICDVGVPEQINSLFARIDVDFGGLDALVVNAGIHYVGSALETGLTDWDRLFAVDVRGAMLCCRLAAQRMAAGSGGAIVVVGSIAAERPCANRSCYCSAKSAVHAYAQAVALEWAPLGIRVNVVSPGPIDTEFIDDWVNSHNGRDELIRRIPLGRLGTAADVAAAVSYLLGDRAAFVTGAILRIDGARVWM